MTRRRGVAVIIGVALMCSGCADELTSDAPTTPAPVEDGAAGKQDGRKTASRRGRRNPPKPVTTTTTAPPPPPTAAPATAPPTTSAPSTIAAPVTVGPTDPTNAAPRVDAKAYAVFDPQTGVLLAGHDVDRQLPVGSVMKLLTAYVAYEAGKPHKLVTAPEHLLISYEESAIGLYAGEELPRDVLIRALLIVSANDAARALAVDIAGSEEAFAERMTAIATSLGLRNTRAANATGLDADGQYSSANDVVAIAALLMRNPTFRQTVARPDATLHDRTLPATNDWKPLYPGSNGIKTGHTTDAGYCIVASAQRDGRELIVAVLGAPTEPARNAAATALLDWGFSR